MTAKRQTHQDKRGRLWSVVVAPTRRADALDRAFWRTLSPEERVVAVHDCTESALKAQGIKRVPRLRRVARVVERDALIAEKRHFDRPQDRADVAVLVGRAKVKKTQSARGAGPKRPQRAKRRRS